MNKSTLIGIGIGAAAVVAVGAFATTKLDGGSPFQSYATVVSVEPAFATAQVPREVCHDETVTRQKPVKDEKRVAGTAIGAVVGGVLGNQVGGGTGKTIATAAGAVAGGYAGNKIQKEMQEGNTETIVEQRCEIVYDTTTTPAGYDVTYELDGQRAIVRMDHHPGDRIPIENGDLLTVASNQKS
jgi:uncharacterized protein YcfJ